ncbi:uncharacterized protein LOC135149316 [Daucus carota subsp. sativus]|uniref:uncharacterized protein LOC135149316 n=1 Tax=Daucus carota subsp. sativus TaxID=79200 RepID=UPI003083B002
MGEKVVIIRLNYDGIFKKDSYAGGKSFAVSKLDTEEFSYSVLMEFVKDYLHLTEIGGIYMGDDSGWKLLTNDKELLKLVDGCENEGEIVLYVDTVVEREIEPSVQMQPWVIVRPRPDITQGTVKEQVKRKFVTAHQLKQQQQKKMKMKQKQTQPPRRILSPRQCKKPVAGNTPHEEPTVNKEPPVNKEPNVNKEPPLNKEPTINKNSTVKRKLNLQDGNTNGKTDIAVQSAAQPLPEVDEYEQERINHVLENRAKFKELGLDKYMPPLKIPTIRKNKRKEQDQ